jgi:phage protein D
MDCLAQQQFVVTGLDLRHRLTRGVKVRTFLSMTDGAVVTKIARENGLRVDVDRDYKPTINEYLLQCCSDFEFIEERARAIGFDWWVQNDVLSFKKPVRQGTTVKVIWGRTLRRFRLRLSSAETGSVAEVRGWDPVQQQAIVGTAPIGTGGLATDAPLAETSVNGAMSSFRATRVAWGTPASNGTEAKKLAEAVAAQLGSEQAVAKGEVLGDPAIRPGVILDVDGLARSLCGRYRLTRVEHLLRAGEPYSTRFESGGACDHTLVDLLNGGSRGAAAGPAAPALGASLVVAVVTNKDDPRRQGRVKVSFAGVAEAAESTWARVVSVGAGKSRGIQVIPDVGDEVLVGFEYGDLRRPLVIGGLWSGRHANPAHPTAGGKDGAVWQTKGGHNLSMSDATGSENYIRLAHSSGKTALRFGIDESSLETEADFTVDSARAVNIKGKSNITVEAQNITVKAGVKLVLEGGAGVEIKTNGQLKIDGSVVDVNAKGMVTVQGGGIAQLKGAMVKIN